MIISQPCITLLSIWIGGVIIFTIIMALFEIVIRWFEKRNNYKIEKTLRSWEELE